jgi:hypothetical protein
MNYHYSPNDIAIFLLNADFPLSKEQSVIHEIWKSGKHIGGKYKHDEALFKAHIRAEMFALLMMLDREMENEWDELELIMRDVDLDFIMKDPAFAEDYILHYFKIIRLELMYTEGKNYRKIKLRRLLWQFGYRRRSKYLVQDVNRALTLLSLTPFLRGYEPTDITSADLDDMIMIRLKENH